ncbi:lysine-rich nucleolar protein 1 isoform X2 [Dendrobates tinctorius]
MKGSVEEYITCTEPTKKKKTQKHDESGKSIVKESQSHSNENKKKKKKASVTEDALEIADVVPKKKKKGKALDEDMASCDFIINNVPKKKKKKNVEDEVLESIDPLHKKEKHSAVEESKEIVTKKKKLKQTEGSLEDKATKIQNVSTDVSVSQKKKKKVSALEEKSGSSKDDQPEMSDYTEAKKIKKKKKTASVQNEDDVIDGHDVHHGEEDRESLRVSKKKKKRKLSITDEKSGHRESALNGSRGKERDIVSDGASKKKNKAKDTSELADEAHESLHVICREEEKQKSKTKKKMSCVQSENDVIDGHEVHHGREDGESLRVSKKKKKRKLTITDERFGHGKSDLNGNRDKEYDDISDGASKKKKRKKAKDTAELADGAHESLHVTCREEEKQKSKMRKKEKMASVHSEDDVIDGHHVHLGKEDEESLRVSKKMKKRKLSITDTESVHGESDLNRNLDNKYDLISDGASKKKKRNKAKEMAESADGAHQSVHVTCNEEEKSVRRKKEKMLKDEEHSANEDTQKVPKKKQKDKGETKNSKKLSKKQEVLTDIPPGPAQDEVHIDKGTKFGQWDTATFQNPEQQSKFLRLLGGFKKGNQANLTSTSNQGKANMALGKQGEQVLERNLQAEFDKALSWKQTRGIGLGFQPAPNKNFYIDKTLSRSVKFND